jgi:hypothetical protein
MKLESLGMTHFLKHRWKDCVVHVNHRLVPLQREYGLFDNHQFANPLA